MTNEADTCRKYVLPKLYTAQWTDDQISEQKNFTDGRILVLGDKCRRKKQKRADYLLKYRRDFPIAVVEAKASYKTPGDGIQQAKEYAEILGLKFAYSTNGAGIIEHDYTTGRESELTDFPSPETLWNRFRKIENIASDETAEKILTPYFYSSDKEPRYYQQIAINRTVQAILQGRKRILLTMATGTGKTFVAFQIAWKLWNAKWNRRGDGRKPRILFLSDRSILVDDPKDKTFIPFADARHKIEGEAIKSREMYFALYHALAEDERRPGLYKEYAKDFFDLIIVDECHRGSASDESNWREILEYFEPAYQLGMTATPFREDNRDTYLYFGNPIYTYSLKQGIEDGFLAPYKVHRIISSVDATGWRPEQGQQDRYGKVIPDGEYKTKDFGRILAYRPRTQAVAQHLTDYLKKTDRFAKTIVFCEDQDEAEEMRLLLNNLNSDLVEKCPDYVCRIVSEEGDIGRGHLSRFQELERTTPVIVTTSKLLTTGVDIQTCKNIVLYKVINSMVDFKQTIGRGTRVRADYGKLYFNILDYTGSATRLFADEAFDGEPTLITQEEIDASGKTKEGSEQVLTEDENKEGPIVDGTEAEYTCGPRDENDQKRKFYVDTGDRVEIIVDYEQNLDLDGKKLRIVKYTDYTAEKVRSIFPSAAALESKWKSAEERKAIIESLEEKGISFDELAKATGQVDADPFDLLCHIAYNAPLRTRRERVERLKRGKVDFFDYFSPEAREILNEILEKYIEHGVAQFKLPDILNVEPISKRGNVIEISAKFNGPEKLKEALEKLQTLLYSSN
ncbi:MAG: DEAD/DEAH box helicase [Omnitrophica bacterium RIFCSPLOWO2_12_FULL_44_17]|uniref:DEAD/DEAH box helicase n=1 Tax=Candidatus Danuiimicrobium aquiferis TaxID=1801832 RepID=A0A1G1KRN0_9BACT|nr:MAG: DEAD/DEAH box helicase [Omnitrophica bacterium RIFCSPHIGHO2_02_FULL_45_28]OGW95573.1 MAG: DEAD/DEAH box helicase [Omnitrophica bacterium RIFCSPLOWO2_12_FULL_44_17]OGX03712.1 MAG: DEAD/DEAH box helicase [Omnitrophica bacterium RIFCSPLOWO2_02_FULL_44_11]